MITVEELSKKQVKIEKDIYQIAKTKGLVNDEVGAMPDGVANPVAYLSNKDYPRIAWIGKEPYDFYEESRIPHRGGWPLTEGFRTNKTWSTRTWQRVIYVMSSLQEKCLYKDLGYIHDYPEMGDVMQSIAWINLSKMPGETTSTNRRYVADYQKYWRPMVMRQLKLYEPEVIVFCNTLTDCFYDIFPEGAQLFDKVTYVNKNGIEKHLIDIYKKNNQFLLDVYHPGRPMSRKMEELYVDKLVKTINNCCPCDH